MALLCAGVDPKRAQMIGRWQSDEMLTYLTMQARPMASGIARRMLRGGDYTLVPGQDVPQAFRDVQAAAAQERDHVGAVLAAAAAAGDAAGNPNAAP